MYKSWHQHGETALALLVFDYTQIQNRWFGEKSELMLLDMKGQLYPAGGNQHGPEQFKTATNTWAGTYK